MFSYSNMDADMKLIKNRTSLFYAKTVKYTNFFRCTIKKKKSIIVHFIEKSILILLNRPF